MNRLVRILLVSVAASVLFWLWYTAWPEFFRADMPSITEDADFALLVRLTGFVVILTVGFYFAVRNIPRK